MIGHKRYLAFRTERLEKQNRLLTILSCAIIIVLIVAITAGPSLVRAISDVSADSTTDVGSQFAPQPEN